MRREHALPIRFALYADTSQGAESCWPWVGARNEHGYGVLQVGGHVERAHRIALELAGIRLSASDVVCHECDNPGCVNPSHLFIGSQRDNVTDMHAKDRGNRGSRNGQAKLSEDDVREIRWLRAQKGWPYDDLAKQYGVGKSTISRIIKRKGWTEI